MEFNELRQRMVDEQLIPRGITNTRVLSAFRKVPRHEFVLEEFIRESYDDHPLPIGNGQTISQPFMVALMTECLKLKGGEKILEVGAGCGYQSAILAELAGEVVTIDRIEALSEGCARKLKKQGYNNIKVITGDGSLGYKEESPYDRIIVTCGAPLLPEAYVKQLTSNGRIVIPIGSRFSQVLTIVERKDERVEMNEVCGCVFVPLVGKDGWDR